MKIWQIVGLVAGLVAVACDTQRASRRGQGDTAAPTLDAPYAAAMADSVRTFAQGVAQDVSRDGPAAWRAHFVESPAFFMAAEGRLVFPSSNSATRGINDLTRQIAHIELRWDDNLRVDPLAPGLAMVATPYYEVRVDAAGRRVEEAGFFTGVAERRAGGWQFRDAHWSVACPPSAVP